MDINKEEFIRRVNENTRTLKKHLKNNKFDIMEYNFLEMTKGEGSVALRLKNCHDLYAAAIVGALPTTKGSGEDGFIMREGMLIPVELKTSYVNRDKIWRSTNNGIFYGSPLQTKASGVTSQFVASFDIKNNMDSKDRLTMLIILDGSTNELIDVYEIDGEQVITRLKYKKNGEERSYKSSVGISFAYFRDHGTKSKTVIQPLGYDKWFRFLKEHAPVYDKASNLLKHTSQDWERLKVE